MNLEPDEDVQAHQQLGQNAGVHTEAEEAVHTAADDEDVEGHVHYGSDAGMNQGVNLAHDDEDDDVEGHVNLN